MQKSLEYAEVAAIIKAGEMFGDFIIVKHVRNENYKNIYLLKCSVCGKEKELYIGEINKLKRVSHKYCSHGLNDGSVEYKKFHSIWTSMRTRTNNPKCKYFGEYGGRGIKSDSYRYFIDFYNDYYDLFLESINKYGIKNVSIDRIENNKSYELGNIRFTTSKTQSRNRRSNKRFKAISPNGVEYIDIIVKDFVSKHLKTSDYTAVISLLNARYQYETVKGWKFCYVEGTV